MSIWRSLQGKGKKKKKKKRRKHLFQYIFFCKVYTCNRTTGACDLDDVGSRCNLANQCQLNTCNPLTGLCGVISKSLSEQRALCNDSNPCTTDTCDTVTGVCNNSPGAVTCPVSDACKVYTCNSTTGACDLNDIGSRCTGANACQGIFSPFFFFFFIIIFFFIIFLVAENFCDPLRGCQVRIKSAAANSLQCNDGNLCTSDTCDVLTGQCAFPPSVTCSPNNECDTYVCNRTTGACDKTVRVCSDGISCTDDLCLPTFPGGCFFPVVSDPVRVQSLCNPTSCQSAVCTATGCNVSALNPLPAVCNSDPCISSPCGTVKDTFCTQTSCINSLTSDTGFSCESLMDTAEKALCIQYVTSGDPGASNARRYCFGAPKTVCPTSTRCTTYTCNATLSQCTSVNIGALCNLANRCQINVCDDVMGCGVQPKSIAAQIANCSDGNACTTDTCNIQTGQCVNTPGAITCPSSDACKVGPKKIFFLFFFFLVCVLKRLWFKIYTCNRTTGSCDLDDVGARCSGANACQENICDAVLGCRTRTKDAAVLASQCSDGNLCTVDTCNVTSGLCVNTPGAITCPTSTACKVICLFV